MSEWCALTRLNSVYFVINDPIPLVLPGRTFAGKWQLHYSVIPSGGREGEERERSVGGVSVWEGFDPQWPECRANYMGISRRVDECVLHLIHRKMNTLIQRRFGIVICLN